MGGTTYAISTFNIDRYTDIRSFLEEYRQIGVSRLELNGRVPAHVLAELLPLIDRGVLAVASVHNFCPRIEENGAEPELSCPLEEERRRAVSYTKRSIETAARVGAEAVVLHPGSVAGLAELDRVVAEHYRSRGVDSEEFCAARRSLQEARRRECAPYLEACERSILELCEYLGHTGLTIRLGLETPYHHYGIPLCEEYEWLFDRPGALPIGLWYDTGHTQVQANLTFAAPEELLRRYAGRLLGLHLHDCRGLDDHKVPGEGDIDFRRLVPYLTPRTIRVLEYGRVIQPLDRVVRGISVLRASGVL